MNLYGFISNDGVNRWDYLGRQEGAFPMPDPEDIPGFEGPVEIDPGDDLNGDVDDGADFDEGEFGPDPPVAPIPPQPQPQPQPAPQGYMYGAWAKATQTRKANWACLCACYLQQRLGSQDDRCQKALALLDSFGLELDILIHTPGFGGTKPGAQGQAEDSAIGFGLRLETPCFSPPQGVGPQVMLDGVPWLMPEIPMAQRRRDQQMLTDIYINGRRVGFNRNPDDSVSVKP